MARVDAGGSVAAKGNVLHLGSGHVAAILSEIHPGVSAKAIDARLKNLQRLAFPKESAGTGKGWRIEYEAGDFLRLVAVFEFLAAGVAPQQAARFVEGQWNEIARGLSDGWTDRDRADVSHVLLARIRGLESAVGEGVAKVSSDGDLIEWRGRRRRTDRRAVVVDLQAVAGAMAEAIAKVASEIPRLAPFKQDVSDFLGQVPPRFVALMGS